MKALNLLRGVHALPGWHQRVASSIHTRHHLQRNHYLPGRAQYSAGLWRQYSKSVAENQVSSANTGTTTATSHGRIIENGDSKLSQTDGGKKSQSGKAKPAIKISWYWKGLILLIELCIGDYLLDRYVFGGVTLRTIVAYGVLGRIGLDYKLHYGRDCWFARHPEEDLHQRNAQRLCTMLKWNGGLYLKAGQALAMQGSVLPEEYQRLFGEMFDDAPKSSWSDVKKVIKQDFEGRTVEEVFGADFEEEPRASASIAQVHFATLPDGRSVAVKVQRREISKQVSWDLWSMKIMAEYTAWSTGLPMGTIGQFVMDQVMRETDFENEAANAEKMAKLVASDPSLRDRVYIPKVYHDLTTKRVLTTEWIDAVQLWDKDAITGNHRLPLPSTSNSTGSVPYCLGLRVNDIMETIIDLFSAQMFSWGFVHCDPHPGNILVRRHPNGSGKPQVVLLDHGLYITMSDKLRRQYSNFWKALVTGDDDSLQSISHEWGMKNADAWADASLMKPYKDPPPAVEGGNEWKRSKETSEERQKRMFEEAAAYLGEEELFPQELVFLERSIGLIQGNNRFLGSPVNRIKLIGMGALRAVRDDGGNSSLMQVVSVRLSLFVLDLAFWWSAMKQYFGYGSGFEQELKDAEERAMRETKDAVAGLFGISVD